MSFHLFRYTMESLLYVVLLAITIVCIEADYYHPDLVNRNAAAFNEEENTAAFWEKEAADALEERLNRPQNKNIARNVIMFLGDGMSVPTLAAARTLKGQRANRTGEETQMSFEGFPSVGLSKTYCLNEQIPDSACTATAYLCGVKTNYGMIGLTGEVPRYNCEASLDTSTHLDSIAAWALEKGKDAGIVTTTRVTHASPAGAYARVATRGWENDGAVVDDGWDPEVCPDIAYQLIHSYPGNQFKVILGGGRREFLPNTTLDEENTRGLRYDGRNLIAEWENIKAAANQDYKYVWNRTDLMNLMESPPEYLLGLFEGTHMQYHMEAGPEEPTLAEMTEIAIRSLNRNENGFFLFVESGRIDHAHHGNYPELSLDETIEMDLAIEKTIELLGVEDTLIVVTADHAHALMYNGYTRRGGDVLEPSEYGSQDNIPYMVLSYSNGPGHRTPVNNQRVDVTQDSNYRASRWRSHAEVPFSSSAHGGEDVAVFATGPYNHLFTGLYEQSQIPRLMAYAACIGPGKYACTSSAPNHQPFVVVTCLLGFLMFLKNL